MQVRCFNCFEQYDREYDVCPYCGYVKGTPAAEPFHINPGLMLQGRYTIGMVLGYGGFGIIYKAWDKKLQTVVAIKEFFPSGIVNRVPGSMNVAVYAKKREMEFNYGFTRFIDEARSMAKFGTHSNIVNVYGYFEENQTAYIVMEYLDGVTLSEFLKNNHLDIEVSLSVIRHVCHALKAVHAAGIIHRDVSPDNIFICAGNKIKLIDFGTARFSLGEEKLLTVILKPGYAPPEQYEKINIQGPWTDIYALGATLYLMLTGVKPDESTNRKVSDALAPPSALNHDISENTSNTIMKAMALDKHMRFKSIDEFEKGLNQELKVIPLKKEIGKRKRRRFITVMASVLVVVVSVSAFTYSYNKQRVEETLSDANLSIWFELTGNDTLDQGKREAYDAIFAAFRESFTNISLDVKAYETDEYITRIQSAIETGNAPVLFETTGLDSSILNNTVNLSDVIGRIDINQYYSFDKYSTNFPEQNQLPLGFVAPVIYINTTLSEITDTSIPANAIINVGSRQQFFAGEAEMILSDTLEFFNVQASLPARYRLLHIDGEDVTGSLQDIWSINECSDNEQKAAERLLLFMLSDNAQDYLYIRNSSGILPLNKNDLDVFVDVYSDFNGFFDNISSYKFFVPDSPLIFADNTEFDKEDPGSALITEEVDYYPVVYEELAIEVNRRQVIFTDQQPVVVDGATLAPARELFEALGYSLSWDSDRGILTLISEENIIDILSGTDAFYVNGDKYTLDVPAMIINGKIMLQFRPILEITGSHIEWDAARNCIVIT